MCPAGLAATGQGLIKNLVCPGGSERGERSRPAGGTVSKLRRAGLLAGLSLPVSIAQTGAEGKGRSEDLRDCYEK